MFQGRVRNANRRIVYTLVKHDTARIAVDAQPKCPQKAFPQTTGHTEPSARDRPLGPKQIACIDGVGVATMKEIALALYGVGTIKRNDAWLKPYLEELT